MIKITPDEKILMKLDNIQCSDKLIDLKRIGDLVLTDKRIIWEGDFLGLQKKKIELKLNDIVKVEKQIPGIKYAGIMLHTKDSKYCFTQTGEAHIILRSLKKHYTGKEPSLIELGEKIKKLI